MEDLVTAVSEPVVHLWEPKHDFYGPERPGFGRREEYGPYINAFDSWAAFEEEGMYHSASGLNFLYRWDWHAWHLEFPDDYPDEAGLTERWELELFWMMPRKGIMARSVIAVTPADEPAVRAWLEPHWAYMRNLWAPLSVPVGAAT